MRDVSAEAGEKMLVQFEAYAKKGLLMLVDLLKSMAAWLRDNGDTQGKKLGNETLMKINKLGDKMEKLPIAEEHKKILESIACGKHNMACSFEVDKKTDPPQHYVFFQAKDSATMTKAFKELTTKILAAEKDKIQNKDKSVEKKLKKCQERSKNQRQNKERHNKRGEQQR